jgi:hypothetical protein
VLLLAQTAKLVGQRPSELLDISDPMTALAFDITCGKRYEFHQYDLMELSAKMTAYQVSKIFGKKEDEDSGEATKKPHWFGEDIFNLSENTDAAVS